MSDKDKIYDTIMRFDEYIADELNKLVKLSQNSKKIDNLSPQEVSRLIEKFYRTLRKVWKSSHTVFSSYEKLRKSEISKCNKQ